MDFLKLLLLVFFCGVVFSPLIAWRMKRGLNPIGESFGEKNTTAGKGSFLYYFLSQIFIGFLGWPALASLFYAISLILNSAENTYSAVLYFILSVFLFVMCAFVIKKLRVKYWDNHIEN